MAKYMLEWTNRDSATGEGTGRRLMDVFSKWTPAAGNIQQFLSRVDGGGGYSVVETDNLLEILRDTTKFSPWLEFTVTPVIDITDAVPVFNEALDFVESVP
jgi:Protein of unknown function (DUF3303)